MDPFFLSLRGGLVNKKGLPVEEGRNIFINTKNTFSLPSGIASLYALYFLPVSLEQAKVAAKTY
ncbi:MAG: hypothetical protein JNK79_11900 [Chitinophagaceae bacterium]|nr:hypothetical protein [Chitinophagaceae bacterium]